LYNVDIEVPHAQEESTMDAQVIVTAFVLFDDMYQHLEGAVKYKPKMGPAEVLTVAVVAAKYCQNHLEQALCLVYAARYIPPKRQISYSRFVRLLHKYATLLEACVDAVLALAAVGEVFIIDSLPVPVCKRVRARRCRKVRGRMYCGYCAAKHEKFYGWRVHLVVNAAGVPVRYVLRPAADHDLTPIYELTYDLPPGSCVLGDKGYISKVAAALLQHEQVQLLAQRRSNMVPLRWDEALLIKRHRKTIEAVNTQLESFGIQRLRARTNAGFELKVLASLLALVFTRMYDN
jgi:hypothetical protein